MVGAHFSDAFRGDLVGILWAKSCTGENVGGNDRHFGRKFIIR
jgi:hypothetical protein